MHFEWNRTLLPEIFITLHGVYTLDLAISVPVEFRMFSQVTGKIWCYSCIGIIELTKFSKIFQHWRYSIVCV